MSINYDGMFEKLKSKDKKALDASITIRLDRAAKKEFEEICEKMGMTVSSAINAFIDKVINLKALPFAINGYKRKRKLFVAEGKFNISDEDWKQMDEEFAEMFDGDDEDELFN